jgi:hypothetical protein
MPPISQPKKDKISEQILHHLFSVAPQPMFTAEISREIARDEEFTRSILSELKTKGFVVEIAKNNVGANYIRRRRWRLSNHIFEAYFKRQYKSS